MSYLNVNYLSYYQAIRQGLFERDVAVISTGNYRDLSEPFLTNRQIGREDWQILCVTKGTGKACIDGRWVPLTAGDCILFKPGKAQCYVFGGEDLAEYWYIHFCGKRIPILIEEIGVPTGLFHIENTSSFVAICNYLMKEIQFKNDLSFYYFEARMLQLFVMLARVGGRNQTIHDPRIGQVIAYMYSHISESLTTKNYAELLHVSENYLIRLFTSNTGISPGDYFMNIKINNAISLLESTKKSISEIADSLGFSDPLYFSRVFRKRVGVSPRAFRNKEVEE